MVRDENIPAEEKELIEKLKKRFNSEDFPPRVLKDETVYYRFLKARNFNLEKAEEMLRKHIVDRKIYHVDEIADEYIPPMHIYDYVPISFVGYDKEGCPIWYYDFGKSDPKGVFSIISGRQLLNHGIHFMEDSIARMDEQSIKFGRPVTQWIYIFDFNYFNIFLATHRKGIDFLYNAFQLYQNNYPERTKAVYIINAQYYFNIGYSIIKPILAEGLVQKIKIFNRSGFQEVLLDAIDADVLPAFLGGIRTDPDGNPLCHSFITHGKPVPKELYLNKTRSSLRDKEGVQVIRVDRLSSSNVTLHIDKPNTLIEWEYELKSKDIAFGLYYKNSSDNHEDMEELIPKERIDTTVTCETGVFNCRKTGFYMLHFDNSYSWIYSKEIYCITRITEPKEKRTNGSV